MLDPKLLQFFVEVADASSFTRAAERLNVTQSWLSRQVVKLEQQIGFRLFDRTSRTVVLTERGRDLLDRARPAIYHVRGVQALAAKLGREEPTLAIGVPGYALMAEPRLKLCDTYLKRYPKVRVDTRIDGYRHLEAALMQGDLDVAFAIKAPGLTDSEDLQHVTVAKGRLDLVMPREDPFASRRSVALADLAERRVAAFSRRSNDALFALIFEPVRRAGVHIMEFSDYSFPRHLGDHDAVTVLPSWQPLPASGLKRVPLTGADEAIDLVCLRLKTRGLPALENFWSLACKQAL